MTDTYITQISADGFKSVIDYEDHLQRLRAELLGERRRWTQVKRIVGIVQQDGTSIQVEKPVQEQWPDGSWHDIWQEEIIPPSAGSKLVNEAGADYITTNLRQLFNKHSAMGNIRTNEEAAKLAARAVQSIFAHVEANSSVYGCDDEKFAALEGIFDVTMTSVYNFFTSMREQELLKFGRDTQNSNYSNAAPRQESQLSITGKS